MKKIGLALVAIILMGCGGSGAVAADKVPYKVEQSRVGGNARLTITSLEDKLEIMGIVINRGNCISQIQSNYDFPEKGKTTIIVVGSKDGGGLELWGHNDKNKWGVLKKAPLRDFFDVTGYKLELSFGRKLIYNLKCSEVLEVEIETDKGTWTSTFQ